MPIIFVPDWRTLVFRGILSVMIGLIAFVMPVATLFALTLLFAAYALIDGLVALVTAFGAGRRGEHWWALLLTGIAGVATSVLAVVWPGVTLLFLVYLIAAWAILSGVLEISVAVKLRRHIHGEWLLIFAGIVTILFGVLLFAAPGPGAVVLTWWIGAYMLTSGILKVVLALRLRHRSAPLNPQHA
ncbi:MAG TPA: HdeD family acid-resistance protein [Bryobacteraceae bacterium]|nr:HdeD family acid-resistance protein [Bryobacteraceae bacterium]